MFILNGFKSCVLEVRIPKGLRVGFSEVRILKGIVASGEWWVARKRDRKLVVRTGPVHVLGTGLCGGRRRGEKC